MVRYLSRNVIVIGCIIITLILSVQLWPSTPEMATSDFSISPTLRKPFQISKSAPVMSSKGGNDFECDISGEKVIIGNDKEGKFDPTVKYTRFGGENWFSLKLNLPSKITTDATAQSDKVVWISDAIDINLYGLTAEESKTEYGAFEYDIILKEKPSSNILSFVLNYDSDTEFYYQPPLNEQFKVGDYDDNGMQVASVTETESRDSGGNIISRMAEDVVGSYAVYSKTKANNEYRTGKIGHLYRPQLKDAEGKTEWGALSISYNILTVTIPQKFLDDATYPISNAAGLIFGYNSTTTSDVFAATNRAWGSFVNTLSSVNGKVDDIKVYCWAATASSFKGFITEADSDPYTIQTNGISPPAAISGGIVLNWYTATFSTKPSVSNGANYAPWAVFNNGGGLYIRRDSTGSGTNTRNETDNNYSSPTNPSGTSGTSYRYSIYADYTETPVAPTITISAATNIGPTTARLNGDVTSTGGDPPTVTVYWGDNDGGTTPGNWDYSASPTDPSQPQGVSAFYYNATGLTSSSTVYFSAKATNSIDTDWPPASLSFDTTPAGDAYLEIGPTGSNIQVNIGFSSTSNIGFGLIVNITNTPDTKNFNVVQPSSTYWARGSEPSWPLANGECTESVTNDSTFAVDISFSMSDMTGGTTWAIGASPASNVFTMKVCISGAANIGACTVLSETPQMLITNLAASASKYWEFVFYTPTNNPFDDGAEKTGTMTLTGEAH